MHHKPLKIKLLKENSLRLESLSRVLKDVVLENNKDNNQKIKIIQDKLLEICIDNDKIIESMEENILASK